MVKLCCVDGCVTPKEAFFFKFPNSRTQRRKWLDAISPSVKITDSSVVCHQHFQECQYDTVRGKTRLKAKVVPSVFDTAKRKSCERISSVPSPDLCKILDTRTNTRDVPTIGKTSEQLSGGSLPPRLENHETGKENGEIEKTKDSIVEINCSESETGDIEDIITNYHIKQVRPVEVEVEVEVEGVADVGQRTKNWVADMLDMNVRRREKAPEFVELPVDKDGDAQSRDCLMVMEKVQVDVDPSLMFPELDDDDDDDVVIVDHKKPDPISLLTSSDEDEVIIQEPHIDTVEVPDETDEDDVPLVKLVKLVKVKGSRKKKSKRLLEKVEYHCVECRFRTKSEEEHKKHVDGHSTVLLVCPVCKYMSASKSQFIRHRRKHKYEKRHKCHLCDYKARHNMSLIYHMKTHAGGKAGAFKCDRCGFESDVKSKVIKHIRACATVFEHCDVAFAEA